MLRRRSDTIAHPGFDWLVVRHPGDEDFTWVAYRPAPYMGPTERLNGTAPTRDAACMAAEGAVND